MHTQVTKFDRDHFFNWMKLVIVYWDELQGKYVFTDNSACESIIQELDAGSKVYLTKNSTICSVISLKNNNVVEERV